MKSQFSLQDKVAIVTGGLGLLGLRHAKALALAGAAVVLVDLGDENMFRSKVKDTFFNVDSEILYISADITKKDEVERIREVTIQKFGKIDVLINNAAINDMVEHQPLSVSESEFENYSLELWNRSFAVNVTGTFLCSQIIGKVMAESGSGSIINIASTYALVGPDQSIYLSPDGKRLMYKSPAYSATKGAIVAFTKYLAAYWGSHGIRVNTLSPGGVKNGQEEFFINNYSARTMLGRMAEPDDYEGAVVFLASDASRYMTGANLVVDGGWTAW